jgi:outer membrane immunogenic protein
MFRRLAFVSASVIALCAASQASDLYSPGSGGYKDAPGASYLAPSWTGFYVGATLGGAWSSNSVALSGLGNEAGWAPYYPDPLRTRKLNGGGVIGGSEFGYNIQMSSVVVGVESDYSGRSDGAGLTSACVAYSCSVYERQRLNWLATTRARIGFAPASRALLYATGGVAVGGASALSRLDFAGGFYYDTYGSETKTGWTVGGGVEYAFSQRWSLKAEYLYVDLDGQTLVTNPSPNPPYNTKTVFEDKESILRAGLNYRIDSTYSPLY